MFISKFQLHLFPVNPKLTITHNELVNLLTKIGFMGETEKKSKGKSRYLSGERFLSHLCFLGCSPDVEFLPNGDAPYIYIEIPEATRTPQFISGINVKVPRCSACKKELSQLPHSLSKSSSIQETKCQHCGVELAIKPLNWRKTAYTSSSSIIIHNIYESEAVPDDQLLIPLEQATGSEWKYAYIRVE